MIAQGLLAIRIRTFRLLLYINKFTVTVLCPLHARGSKFSNKSAILTASKPLPLTQLPFLLKLFANSKFLYLIVRSSSSDFKCPLCSILKCPFHLCKSAFLRIYISNYMRRNWNCSSLQTADPFCNLANKSVFARVKFFLESHLFDFLDEQ